MIWTPPLTFQGHYYKISCIRSSPALPLIEYASTFSPERDYATSLEQNFVCILINSPIRDNINVTRTHKGEYSTGKGEIGKQSHTLISTWHIQDKNLFWIVYRKWWNWKNRVTYSCLPDIFRTEKSILKSRHNRNSKSCNNLISHWFKGVDHKGIFFMKSIVKRFKYTLKILA